MADDDELLQQLDVDNAAAAAVNMANDGNGAAIAGTDAASLVGTINMGVRSQEEGSPTMGEPVSNSNPPLSPSVVRDPNDREGTPSKRSKTSASSGNMTGIETESVTDGMVGVSEDAGGTPATVLQDLPGVKDREGGTPGEAEPDQKISVASSNMAGVVHGGQSVEAPIPPKTFLEIARATETNSGVAAGFLPQEKKQHNHTHWPSHFRPSPI